jgi:hypothetical protein
LANFHRPNLRRALLHIACINRLRPACLDSLLLDPPAIVCKPTTRQFPPRFPIPLCGRAAIDCLLLARSVSLASILFAHADRRLDLHIRKKTADLSYILAIRPSHHLL